MSLILPATQMSPDICDWMATGGEEAVRFLESYGLPISSSHPLREAIRLLKEVARTRSYGDQETMQRVVSALLLLRDFHQIGQALTVEPVAAIQKELAVISAAGGIGRALQDIRTQFWFGAMLAHGGLRPAVPPISAGRRPDFVVFADGLEISVEVKRPESLHSAFRAVKTAAGQIRDYKEQPGFVALDLGSALDADVYASALVDSGKSPVALFERRFRTEALRLSTRIRGLSPNGAFGRILGVVLFARVAGFSRSDSPGPEGAVFVEAPLFERACSGLIRDTGARVRNLMLGGLSSMSGAPVVEGRSDSPT